MRWILLFLSTAFLYAKTTYQETLFSKWTQSFQIDQILHEEKSDFWDLILFENSFFGRVLAIDGTIQLTERDEFFYSEMMAHVPLLSHPNPREILIVGGGDGCILREVLKHKTVEKVTLVEIDNSVIEIAKKYFPDLLEGAFENPHLEVKIRDAKEFVKTTQDRFDVIISDITDPIGPARDLFEREFFQDCKHILKEGGILVNQNGVPFLQEEEMLLTLKSRQRLFSHVSFYLVPVPTYIGGFMALGWATDRELPSLKELEERLVRVEGTLRYYNPRVHLASFALPNNLSFRVKSL